MNVGSIHLWGGTINSDIYIATSDIFQIRGYGGDDTLTGNSRSNTFVFEKTLAENGKDTITNFKVYNPITTVQDTLDISLAFDKGFNKLINANNVGNYIWIKNGDLYIDTSGNHGSTSQEVIFAHLDGINNGDQLHIRTAGFDGLILATEDLTPPVINGSDINETINGTSASEIINGHGGNDSIFGGQGNDIIAGGTGADTMTGSQGADTFVFNSGDYSPISRDASGPNLYLYGGIDLITDFDDGSVSGDKDILRINGIDYDINDIETLIATKHVATVDSNGDFNLSGTAFVPGEVYIMFGTYSNSGTTTFTDARTDNPSDANAMLFFVAPTDPNAYSSANSVILLYSSCDLGVIDFINPFTYPIL